MRVVIQRVCEASVSIEGDVCGEIANGLLILLGITENDSREDVEWLVGKIIKLRIFSDHEGKMNQCLTQVHGELLVVSQFTLHASTKKGNRPSFIKAAHPDTAIPLYEYFLQSAEQELGQACAKGQFGADMQVQLTNDGPVTITMDSKARE